MAKQKPANRASQPQPTKTPPVSRSSAATSRPVKAEGVSERTLIILLIAIAFIINIRTVSYSYTYDDTVFTTEQSYIGIKGLGAIPGLFTHAKNYNYDKSNTGSWRPLLPITFCIEHEFFGFKPAVSHFINLLIFGAMLMVLYKLLRRMFSSYSIYIPFFILLLFELHPVHTEVIASVKSRDELMTFTFTALAMLQSFKFIDNNNIKHLLLSFIYYFIALLAKESPLPFVALVPVTLYFFSQAKWQQLFVATVPYAIGAVVFVVLGYAFLDKVPNSQVTAVTENTLMAAKNLNEQWGTAFFIQLRYLGLLLFPHPLSFDYSYNQIPIMTMGNIGSILGLVLDLWLFIYAVLNMKNKSVYAYGILFYFIALSVTSNIIILIGTTMGERLLFIPSLGFCIIVVFLLARLFKADVATLTYSNAGRFSYTVIAICVLYSAKTMARNEDWQNNLTLFKSGAEICPNSWRTQFCVGAELKLKVLAETDPVEKEKLMKEAVAYLNRSLAIYPNKPDTHADLGAIYLTWKKDDSAIVHLGRAVALNPKLSSAAANLGTVYLTQQKYLEAAYYYRMTIAEDPNNNIAVFNKAVCDVQFHSYDSAVYNFKRSFELDPNYNNHKAIEYTAITYKMMGKMDSAIRYMNIAKSFNPAFTL